MKKFLIILNIFLIFGCKSKEERIVGYFEHELQKTNLKINNVDGLDIYISPIKNSYESYTPNVYDLITIENEDSLRLEIKKTVEHINKWFDLPKWEQTKGNIYPYISEKTEYVAEPKYLQTELSNNSSFYFVHHNQETHRHHNINEFDLLEWKKKRPK